MKNLLIIIIFIIFTLNVYSKKVITLGLTSTEISMQYLKDGELVACDTWSKGVQGTLGAVDLGLIQELKFDLIKDLNPDIIIIDPEFAFFGNKEKIDALGFKTYYLPSKYSKEQTLNDIEKIAGLVGKPNAYSDVKSEFKTKYAAFELIKKMNMIKSKAIYLESNYNGGLMIAGKNTCPYYLLKECGNKIKLEYSNWTTITKSEIEKIDADVIYLSNSALTALGGTENAIKFFENTKAGKSDKIIIIEDWKMKNHGIYVSDILLEIVGTFNNDGF